MSRIAIQHGAAIDRARLHSARVSGGQLLSAIARRFSVHQTCLFKEEMMAKKISRRALLASGVAVAATPAVMRSIPAQAQSNVIKIGHVSPKTGPLAGFGEADGF